MLSFIYKLKKLFIVILLLSAIIQLIEADSFKTEVEVTPDPISDITTKKSSGFFGGIKKLFGSGTTTKTTTTTTISPIIDGKNANPNGKQLNDRTPHDSKNKPVITSPLMPFGPKTETLSSSLDKNEASQGPQSKTNGIIGPTAIAKSTGQNQKANNINLKPQIPPGFEKRPIGPHEPYQSPKSQPSSIDLSYGGGRFPAPVNKPSIPDLDIKKPTTAPITNDKTISSADQDNPFKFDLRMADVTDVTTDTKKTTTSTVKEDFPALPSLKKPTQNDNNESINLNKPITGSNDKKETSPSPWQGKHPIGADTPKVPLPSTAKTGISFVPESNIQTTTTIRPGFSDTVGKSLATDEEIRSLTEVLYSKEVSNLISYIKVNTQGKTRSIDSADEAPEPLLKVDTKAFENPSVSKMRLLFNNYEMDISINEHVTPNERKEENDFLDTIMATNVMRQAMLFLQSKGLVTPDPKTHRDLVKELWFTQYSRGNGKIGSSGFEHVFVNEVKNSTIIGLHNWVYFHDEEQAGHLDYKGYLNQLDLGTKAKIMKVRFSHNGLNKPVNTLFIGTSPELELALYTICFELRPDRTCSVSLGNQPFGIITYSWRYRGKNLIGSAYPEI